MDKRIVLITIAGLIAANLSCTNKTGGQQKQQVEEKSCLASEESDSVQLSVCKKSKDFRMTEKDDCYVSVYKKPIGNGVYCDFFITNGENGYRFMVYDSSKDRYYDINFNADDYLNDGVPGMSGFASPDGRYVYVVGDILANSTGWVSTFIIYQIDTKTLKAKLVNAVAAIRLEKNGFTVASMARSITPEASCSAEMDFAFEDITYGFDGKVRKKSKEYASSEIETRYGNSLCNVKGLGIRRGEN